MKPLTKSLHTVTALVRLAQHLEVTGQADQHRSIDLALIILGHDASASDPTFKAAKAALKKTRVKL